MLSFWTSSPVYLSLLLSLWSSPVLSCGISDRRLCDSIDFVTGHDVIGEGFDVVTWQRTGKHVLNVSAYLSSDNTCSVRSNPLAGNVLQKMPTSLGFWRAYSDCRSVASNSTHASASSLLSSYINQDSNDWRSDLDWDRIGSGLVAGSKSDAYEFASNRELLDSTTFSSHAVSCSFYSLRARGRPLVNNTFDRESQLLPNRYNSNTSALFKSFITSYGTHYIHEAELGGQFRQITATRQCLATLNGFSTEGFHTCMNQVISDGLKDVSDPDGLQSCGGEHHTLSSSHGFELRHNYTEVVGGSGWDGTFPSQNYSGGLRDWLKTLKNDYEAFRYSLRPLHVLVRGRSRREALKTAIEEHLRDNAVRPEEPRVCDTSDPNLDRHCCPLSPWKGNLTVNVIRGWGLKGDRDDETEAFVSITYGTIYRRTRVIVSNNPEWNVHYDLGSVYTNLKLKVELWDMDFRTEEPLGSCRKVLMQGSHKTTCSDGKGSFEFEYNLSCDPHLTGERCDQYNPSVSVQV